MTDSTSYWSALRGSGCRFAELTRYPVITYPRNTNPYVQVHEFLARSNLPPPRLYSNASLSTIVRMAVEGVGVGVGVIPAQIVRPELAHDTLRIVDTVPENVSVASAAEIARETADAWCRLVIS